MRWGFRILAQSKRNCYAPGKNRRHTASHHHYDKKDFFAHAASSLLHPIVRHRHKKINMPIPVIAIVGPTASGKSDAAVVLALLIKKYAKRLGVCGAEIISADSRQVYQGFDLTSGKVTQKEMRGIPHHLLDVASPRRTFTVARYQTLGRAAIKKIMAQNKIPIICGGTGMFVDALLLDGRGDLCNCGVRTCRSCGGAGSSSP